MINFFKISKFFLILPVLAVALVTTSTLFPFIVGKYSLFRTSIDLALIFFLLGIIFLPEAKLYEERLSKIFKTPLVIAISVFVSIFLLAGFFGVDPKYSFWSNFERGEGGLQMLHFYAFFILLLALFREKKDWWRIFTWSIIGALLMIAYGILNGFGYKGFIGPLFSDSGYRFSGSIGNPAYVASYLIFMLYFAFYFFISGYKKIKSWRSIILLILGAVFLVFFVLAATRGAFLGLAGSVFAFLACLVYSHKPWRKWLFTAMAAFILILALMFGFKNYDFIKKIPASRILDISFSARTFEDRAIIWKMAFDGFKERPILGWGPENFINVFDRHFNTAYFRPSEGFGSWFDRAHNVFFDYLAETGILGILAYISIFAVFYLQFFGIRRKTEVQISGGNNNFKNTTKENLRPKIIEAILFSVPVAYLIQGLVLFDVFTIYINLFLFFAFSAYYFRFSEKEE